MIGTDTYWREYGDDDADHIKRLSRLAFTHEVECYGLCDGVDRLPMDPAYIHYPEYRRGHVAGMAMEPSKEALANGRA
jgi:hypothetical protein